MIGYLSLASFIHLYFIQLYSYSYFHQKEKVYNKRNFGHNRQSDSKASLFRGSCVSERIIRGRMEDKDRIRLFVDQVDDEIDLERKKNQV